jgi:cytolysin (calcineurin-like family phosphatase)
MPDAPTTLYVNADAFLDYSTGEFSLDDFKMTTVNPPQSSDNSVLYTKDNLVAKGNSSQVNHIVQAYGLVTIGVAAYDVFWDGEI